MLRRLLVAFTAVVFVVSLAVHGQAQDAQRGITNVKGDVYRFQNNFHYGLVVVTGAGTVVVDPINEPAAAWLKDNLAQITTQPITHLIYSHSHDDHASGGGALDAGTIIAHENAPPEIDGVAPTMRFKESKSLEIGDKTLELVWLGEGHGKDLIAVVVRPENVAFVVDAVAPKRLPYRDFPRSNVDGWIDQVRRVEALDFEILAPGHGNVGVKADATDGRIYMEELRAQVLAGLKAGKSEDELAAAVTMDAYRDWSQYDSWRELNVRGMARFLKESGQLK